MIFLLFNQPLGWIKINSWEARKAGFKARLEERKRQIVKTAILKEKMKGAKEMDRIKYGGFVEKLAKEQMKEDSRELLEFSKMV